MRPRLRLTLLAALLLALGAAGVWWWKSRSAAQVLPEPGSPRYQEYVELFLVGEAAADTDQYDLAVDRLGKAIALVPGEPAAWADRGLVYLRQNQDEQAARDLAEAHRLAPDDPDIEALLGHLDRARGDYPGAAAHFRKALAARPRDLQALYALARSVEQEAGPDADAEYQRLIGQGLEIEPFNYRLLRESASAALRRGDAKAFNEVLDRYRKLSADWAPAAREALRQLEEARADGVNAGLLTLLNLLDNVLQAERGYQRSAAALEGEAGKAVGTVVDRLLRLAPLPTGPAPADAETRFAAARPASANVPGPGWHVALPVWLTKQSPAAVFVANGREVRRADGTGAALTFPGGAGSTAPSAAGVVPVDWNNDFLTDFLLAGAGGLRFYQARADGSFADVTDATRIPPDVLRADYYGAWPVDYDADGDLDLVLAPRAGGVLVLRNNGDGTFKPVQPFGDVKAVRAFAWADLDHDGAAAAALVDDRGRLHVFANERMGQFRERPPPQPDGKFLALAVADADGDGVLDLIALRADGALLRVSDRDKGKGWDVAELVRWSAVPADAAPGSVRLLTPDLDNNGASDLLVSGPKGGAAWLAEGGGRFTPLAAPVPAGVFAAADLTGDGRPDLLGVSDGRPVRCDGEGSRNYSWQLVRPEAVERGLNSGDNRVNSFGVGGEVEVRAGNLVQKVPITGPVVPLGLGTSSKAQVVRIVWPNGTFQVEFEAAADQTVAVLQRLKGSCPFLFADDGHGVKFVTDFLWSTPLGMYINGQDKGGFLQTTDWVKVRGGQVAAKGGFYDLRVQANLWETHYLDFTQLKVVDHPADTEVFVDERFFLTPTAPRVYVTDPPRPVYRAWDHHGDDVTEVVARADGRYLDRAGRGRYQGITNDHWVEVDLGGDAPEKGPVYLLATGFVHPTDSSINFAMAQGSHEPPRALVLEVPDGKGGWKVGRPALGFPAGKNKTVVIRLDGIEGDRVTRHFRLRTNLEIYWDALAYARGRDDSLARVRDLEPDVAELRYKGVLETTRADDSSPELPHYDRVLSRRQYWRDLEGYYTRYGDVRELLAKADDRYVIVNAGDEIAFRFRAPQGPPPGWKRDFVWVSDGWVKDGDLNTRFSKTVLPLPAHGMQSYLDPPGRLEDDPVYRRFPGDWRKYHTRYVTPSGYERGLRPERRP